MQWSDEIENKPSEEKDTRSEIYEKGESAIMAKFEWVKKFPAEERGVRIFGAIFETLAVLENIEKHPETDLQSKTRKLIEELYEKAAITLGEEWASRPDDVSVGFDTDGHLEIQEILEIKTSVKALNHGLEKKQSQPQNSIQTIEKIVELINSMINAPDIDSVEAIGKLGYRQSYRKNYLIKTFKRIEEMRLTENISFSSDLQYHVILPDKELNNIPKFEVTHKGRPIKTIITTSQFSKKNIHAIIDHYQETP